jgi:NAD-dependent dihydropyrimidine dehydrogenase PreA subunit
VCRIDGDRCHQCFCCYELGPAGAIKVRGALGALLRRNDK